MSYLHYEPEILVDAASDQTVSLTAQQTHKVDPMNSGFIWYTPPMSASTHRTDGRQWLISGHDMQVLTMTVPSGEEVVTEVGSFMFGSSGIKTSVELTLCSRTGLMEGVKRIFGGESCVKVMLENEDNGEGYVGLTPNYPAKIIPIKFGEHINEDHALYSQGGVYMSQLGDVDVGCHMDCFSINCCCAGFGCCRQKITGTRDSVAFLAAGGTLVYKHLEPNEIITVDSRSVVAMEETVSLGVTPNGKFCTLCLGGEGCCSTTLSGPGKVFMQSMNYGKFKDAVTQTIIDDRGSSNDSSGGAQFQ